MNVKSKWWSARWLLRKQHLSGCNTLATHFSCIWVVPWFVQRRRGFSSSNFATQLVPASPPIHTVQWNLQDKKPSLWKSQLHCLHCNSTATNAQQQFNWNISTLAQTHMSERTLVNSHITFAHSVSRTTIMLLKCVLWQNFCLSWAPSLCLKSELAAPFDIHITCRCNSCRPPTPLASNRPQDPSAAHLFCSWGERAEDEGVLGCVTPNRCDTTCVTRNRCDTTDVTQLVWHSLCDTTYLTQLMWHNLCDTQQMWHNLCDTQRMWHTSFWWQETRLQVGIQINAATASNP